MSIPDKGGLDRSSVVCRMKTKLIKDWQMPGQAHKPYSAEEARHEATLVTPPKTGASGVQNSFPNRHKTNDTGSEDRDESEGNDALLSLAAWCPRRDAQRPHRCQHGLPQA